MSLAQHALGEGAQLAQHALGERDLSSCLSYLCVETSSELLLSKKQNINLARFKFQATRNVKDSAKRKSASVDALRGGASDTGRAETHARLLRETGDAAFSALEGTRPFHLSRARFGRN